MNLDRLAVQPHTWRMTTKFRQFPCLLLASLLLAHACSPYALWPADMDPNMVEHCPSLHNIGAATRQTWYCYTPATTPHVLDGPFSVEVDGVLTTGNFKNDELVNWQTVDSSGKVLEEHAETAGQKVRQSCVPWELKLRMASRRPQLTACAKAALRKDAELSGKVVIDLTIAPNGGVYDARVVDNTLKDVDLRNCVLRAYTAVRFSPTADSETCTMSSPMTLAVE